MKHFLVVFDRRTGVVVRDQEFLDRTAAIRARFDQERAYSDRPDIEVVVLGAESVGALRHTHARYFQTVGDLARTAASRVEAA